jgi:hypothetical protein
MPKGKHSIALKWLNPKKDVHIKVGEMLIYSDGPQPVAHQ